MQLITIGSPVSAGAHAGAMSKGVVAPYTQSTGSVTCTNREIWQPFFSKASLNVSKIVTYETSSTLGNYKVGIADKDGNMVAESAERAGGGGNAWVFHDVTDFSLSPGQLYFARLIAGSNTSLGRFNQIREESPLFLTEAKTENVSNWSAGLYKAKVYDGAFTSELPNDGSETGFSTGFFFGLEVA